MRILLGATRSERVLGHDESGKGMRCQKLHHFQWWQSVTYLSRGVRHQWMVSSSERPLGDRLGANPGGNQAVVEFV